MPSKLKKSANKTPSRLSNSDQYQSPGALPSTPSPDSEAGDEDFSLSLREASSRFPSMIGESAFVGRVVDIQHESKGCKIWLSEPSMVASSLSPGAIVSVSLAVRSNLPYGFPLCPLPGECDGLVAIDDGSSLAYEAGDYFALATVYPSSKIVKNGVRFSSSLSYTMGGLTSGRVVFVYCIQNQSVTSFGSESDNRHRSEGGSLCIYNCKELCLELAPSAIRSSTGNSLLTTMKSPIEKARCQIENGGVASPKTPVYQSRLNSLNSRESASPIYQESVSSSPKPNSLSSDSLDVNEVLRNENAKKLLETCATTWLYSRILLCGNVVSIPMFSEICTFRVIGAKKLSLHGITHELMNERSRHLFSEVPELLDQSICAFAINHQTRVVLQVPLTLASGNPQESVLSSVGHKIMDVRSKGAGAVSKLGGLSKEYAILKDIIVSSSIGDTLSSFGLRTTKGVLLHGTSGTGKTSLAQLCARDAGVNLFSVNGPEIISQYFGESEKALHEVFDSAIQAAPAVVFIDELDSIAPARKDGGEELSHRMVATLLNVMDGISRTNGLLVIAATNRPESIEPALRRPGRLDREIEIGVPSPLQRLDILLTLLSQMEHSLSKIQVQQLAMSTHGFVGADLAFLCNEAGLVCLRRFSKSKNSESKLKSERTDIPNEGCSDHTNGWSYCLKDTRDTIKDSSDSESSCVSNVIIADTQSFIPLNGTVSGSSDDINNGAEDNCILKVSFEDFEKARMKVRPSAMREVILEVPKVKWEDVGGQREIKAQLIEAVEWPQKHQEAFKRIGTRPPTGILLFGPPGCSKTLMARAVASEAGLNFLAVKGPELFSKWVGESEKAVRSLFAKARANAPSIIFFDEIDGLAITRGKESDGISVSDRVMSQLLVELDGLHQRVNVTVIAATNRPDKIDPALLRPGRFDRLLYVGPPNEIDREEIFCIHLRKIACNSDINIKKLASLTRSCTGADISLICREAALAALEESLSASEITMQHLKTAIKQVVPSEVQPYHELSKKFERIVYTSREGEVGYQQCSRQSNDFSLWSPLKFVGLFLHRIWTIISLSKSVSDG